MIGSPLGGQEAVVSHKVRYPRMLVETSDLREMPKIKTDDKQLRQAQVGEVENNTSPGLLEYIDVDGNRVVYAPSADIGSLFIQLNF